jgi:hypothetical protein
MRKDQALDRRGVRVDEEQRSMNSTCRARIPLTIKVAANGLGNPDHFLFS